MVIPNVDSTLSLPEAVRLFDMATNPGHPGRRTHETKRLAKKLGKQQMFKNHFNEATISGLSVLNFAAQSGHVLLAKVLMKYLGANPNIPHDDITNRRTLHYACESGKLDLVTELINVHHCDAGARDLMGSTPLHLAIFGDHSRVAVYIVQSGADIVSENHLGRPIHAASFSGDLSTIIAIAGRDPLEINVVSGLFTPLTCALYGEEPECERYLMERCSLEALAIFYKVICSKDTQTEAVKSVTLLLERNADPNISEELLYEDPAIICAAKKNWSEVVSLLLPTTNHIPDVDWTVPGLIAHVNTDEFKLRDTERINTRVTNLKSQIIQELHASNALNALSICVSLKSDMNPVEWGYFISLCKFLTYMWFKACPVTCNHESIALWVNMLSGDPEKRNWAIVGTEACLALSPNNHQYMHLLSNLTGH